MLSALDQQCHEWATSALNCAVALAAGTAGPNTLYGYGIRIPALANRIIAARTDDWCHTLAEDGRRFAAKRRRAADDYDMAALVLTARRLIAARDPANVFGLREQLQP